VRSSSSPEILVLNALFAERCVEICQCLRDGRFNSRHLSLNWIDALLSYVERPLDVATALPNFAATHILDDLEGVLFEVLDRFRIAVQKSAFDSVLDDIEECLDEISAFDRPIERILWVIAKRSKLVRVTLYEWREIAWTRYERRVRLKQALEDK